MPVIPDMQNAEGRWLTTKKINGKQILTISGMKWENLVARCTPGSHTQRLNPAYIGCTNEFKGFHEFCEWHQSQVGYGHFEVDKDLLIPGNKVYSARTCLLIPRAINKALITKRSDRGMPPGVYRSRKRYYAQLNLGGTTKRLGTFDSIEEAEQAYLAAKREVLRAWAEEYKDRLDPRAYEALYAR